MPVIALHNRPFADDRIFWDTDINKLDYTVNDSFIIQRVIERGDVQDIRNCRRYYAPERIAAVLTTLKYLPLRKIYLASAIIDKPLSAFRCYTERQLTTAHLPY
jgi:hypothetical protein